MNGAGLFLATAGVWVLAQILAGDALDRLEIFGGPKQSSAAATNAGKAVEAGTLAGVLSAVPGGSFIGGILDSRLAGGKKKPKAAQ